MSDHKFEVGQTVSSTAGYFGRANMTDIYKIWQLLPPQGEDQQYRIKSANEPHERVAKESELARAVRHGERRARRQRICGEPQNRLTF